VAPETVFDAGCSTSQYDKTITSMEVDLDTPSAITGMEFDGSTSGYAVIAGSFASVRPAHTASAESTADSGPLAGNMPASAPEGRFRLAILAT
jgi:hypothetical protein